MQTNVDHFPFIIVDDSDRPEDWASPDVAILDSDFDAAAYTLSDDLAALDLLAYGRAWEGLA